MAYSLGDPYRPLRIVLRVNGLLVGLGLGTLLAFLPRAIMANTGLQGSGGLWVARLAGAALIALGVLFLFSAGQRVLDLPLLVACALFHGLAALLLLVSYLQRELTGLALFGQLALLLVFILCLAGALAPVRYFRAEFQA